jgi:hypothetical protein
MGILNFLRPTPYKDPAMGELVRKGGRWRGRITLESQADIPLLLAGSGTKPDAASLELARELGSRYPTLRPAIEAALFEHYEPYLQAVESGETEPSGAIPRIAAPGQVWKHVALVRVLIEPLGGIDTVEIAYRTAWDEEHTLGPRFQDWALVELNGSVI